MSQVQFWGLPGADQLWALWSPEGHLAAAAGPHAWGGDGQAHPARGPHRPGQPLVTAHPARSHEGRFCVQLWSLDNSKAGSCDLTILVRFYSLWCQKINWDKLILKNDNVYYVLCSQHLEAKNSIQLPSNAFAICSHCSRSNFLTRPMLFCFFFLVAGCLLQQSRQGTDGEIPEEPRLLTAGQSVVHPPGKPGTPRVFPGDALRATCGPGGRVSPGIFSLLSNQWE